MPRTKNEYILYSSLIINDINGSCYNTNSRYSGKFTIGSFFIDIDVDYEFISDVINNFTNVIYVLLDNGNIDKNFLTCDSSRVLIVSEKSRFNFISKIDLYIPYVIGYDVNVAASLNKMVVSGPLDPNTFQQQYDDVLDRKDIHELYIDILNNKSSKNLFIKKHFDSKDLFYTLMNEILPEEKIEELYYSKKIGKEKTLLELQILLLYPAYKELKNLIWKKTFNKYKLPDYTSVNSFLELLE